MKDINDLILKKANELAWKHVEIMEQECKKACEKYNCKPEELIIEYHSNTEFKIKIQASHFNIENKFTFHNGKINK